MHEAKKPRPLIGARLLQTLPAGRRPVLCVRNPISLHSGMGKVLLGLGQPPGAKWGVRQDKDADNGHGGGYCTLNDE